MDDAGLPPPDQLPTLPTLPPRFVPPPPPAPVVAIEPSVSVVVATPPMPRRKGLRLGIVAGIVLLGLAIGSFVWATRTDKPRFSLSASAAATKTIETVRFEMDLNIGGHQVPISGTMDVLAKVMQMDVDGSEIFGGQAITSVSAILDLDGLVMYIDAQAVGQPLPQGKTWVRMDLRKLADQMGVDLSELTIGTSTNPLDATQLATNATDSTDMGRETILDGVEAEHFQFDVSVDDALKAAGTSRDQLDTSGGADLPELIKVNAWVDADNRVRQIEFSLDVAGQSADFAICYTEINPVVNITLPTKAESMDLFDLLIGG